MHTYTLLGALDENDKYVRPAAASKAQIYRCPDCLDGLILRAGKINRPHFAHRKKDNPCKYYSHPSESQIHKDAKYLLKHLLENKSITIVHDYCNGCQKNPESVSIPKLSDNSKIILEYRFEYNDGHKIADVAYVVADEIKYIFEICHTHKTSAANRPEPWFEFDAISLINSNMEEYNVKITNIRKCTKCPMERCKNCGLLEWKWLIDCHDGCCSADCAINPRIYINVSYKDKEYAKGLGCQFDWNLKKWFFTEFNIFRGQILDKWQQIEVSHAKT